MNTHNAVEAQALPKNGMTIDQLYEQAKAIRPDVESVNHTEWKSAGGREHKFFAFTEGETFLATTSDALLADLLASVKQEAA